AGGRAFLERLAGPHDVAATADLIVLGVDETVAFVHRLAQHGTPAQQVADADIAEVGEVLLRVDDAVEVAAVGDIDGELAELGDFDLEVARVQEARDIGDANLVDIFSVLLVFGHNLAGRDVEVEDTWRLRLHETVLDRHGHRADGAVPAH